MFFYVLKGGPILVVIGFVSVAAGAIVLIQWFRVRQALNPHSKPLQELARLLQKRDWLEAVRVLENHRHPFLASWRTGLLLLIEGKHEFHDIEEAVTLEGNKFMTQMEALLRPLGAITTILPMLGFLGTIVGLISSFRTWEQLGAQVSISALASGIYQAMITTAAGLCAAIPYYLLYHLLVARTHRVALDFSKDTTQMFRWVKAGLAAEPSVNSEEPHPVL